MSTQPERMMTGFESVNAADPDTDRVDHRLARSYRHAVRDRDSVSGLAARYWYQYATRPDEFESDGGGE